MFDRRGIYFTFQGLLVAVLLLMFLYQYREASDWVPRFAALTAALLLSLAVVRLVGTETLRRKWFQSALFISDAALASITLRWTNPGSDLYLIYVLILFGTALTRNLSQTFLVGLASSILYYVSSGAHAGGLAQDTGFWLRLQFLWITTALLAILARDTQKAETEQALRYQERLVQSERMAALGRMAGEVAHRIKGPLTTILVDAEVLSSKHAKSKGLVGDLAEIEREVHHCKRILQSLLDLGRIEETEPVPVDLRDPLASALRSVQAQARKHGTLLEARLPDSSLDVRGDASMLHEAFHSVLQNAVDATAGRRGGRISLGIEKKLPGWRLFGARKAGHYLITIEDNGVGMESGTLRNVFQPFFTTKGKEGSGLGLSAALRILHKHGGGIEAASDGPGKGARFAMTIPCA